MGFRPTGGKGPLRATNHWRYGEVGASGGVVCEGPNCGRAGGPGRASTRKVSRKPRVRVGRVGGVGVLLGLE